MIKYPLKAIPNRTAMKLTVPRTLLWRQLPIVAMLSASCILSGISQAYAQDPSQNAAALNFVGADIESVVKAIGHYTGTTFIIDPRVKGQINLVSEKPLSKDQAFKLLASSLRLQGYAVVTADGYSKVVPEADAKLQAGPTQTDAVKGDQIATQIYRLNYESANNIVTVLRPLISPNNTINANPGNNSIVITDYADNLKRLSKIIGALDVPANNDLEVVPIKYAIASDIATMVARLTDSNQVGAGDSGRTVLLADPRTNSVLIKAPSTARANLVKSLIAKLDQPTALPGNVHVVYLKNAEAVKLAQTLRSILSSDSALPSSGGANSSLTPAVAVSAGLTGAGAANTSAGSTGLPGSSSNSSQSSGTGGGFIQADSATNTLIITASESVYRNLRGVIDQLDARRAQVYVEALIVEVAADKSNEFGIQWLAATGDENSKYRVGAGSSFGSGSNSLFDLAKANVATKGSLLPGAGMTVGLFRQIGGQLGLGALAHALESDGNTNVLSIPNLLTLDNEEAKIVVGQNVPFITGQYTSAGTANANPFQTVERKDVGLKLTVKPQISEGGTVKLAIYQEASSVIEKSISNASGLTTNQRSISTTVLVEDGQIIALGGLIQDDKTDNVDKVPLLGDIPYLGNLFKYQGKKRTKTNLMVFLRPTVIRNAEQSNSVSLDRYDYMRTQITPDTESGRESFLPKTEKGYLMSTPLSIPAEKPKTDNTGAK
ncbi:type II secretion system secretin GspD [Undibacterium sp.]|uniref:type II secretion system secretin GspD n=1 Tax=Undibacterium sp. TaxID=1914977 RepID=UPI002729DEA1|nr:type II secretion system secretin GspD [Undibacterium sp.]